MPSLLEIIDEASPAAEEKTIDRPEKRRRQLTLGSFFGGSASKANAATKAATTQPSLQRRQQLRDIVVGVFPKSQPAEATDPPKSQRISLSPAPTGTSAKPSPPPECAPPPLSPPRRPKRIRWSAECKEPKYVTAVVNGGVASKENVDTTATNALVASKVFDIKAVNEERDVPKESKALNEGDTSNERNDKAVNEEGASKEQNDIVSSTNSEGHTPKVQEDTISTNEEGGASKEQDGKAMLIEGDSLDEQEDASNAVSLTILPTNLTTNDDGQGLSDSHTNPEERIRLQSLRQSYRTRLQELLQLCHQRLPEEQVPLQVEPLPPLTDKTESFPDAAILSLASIIEGQSLPLDELTSSTTKTLNTLNQEHSLFSEDMVRSKIQLLATRKPFLKPGVSTEHLGDEHDTSSFFKIDDNRLQRWELVLPSVESYTAFFPNPSNRTLVKKARAARKKISAHLNALFKALAVLRDAEKVLSTTTSDEAEKKKQEKALARVSVEVQKIDQLERELEAQRLEKVARMEQQAADRRQKELAKQQKLEAAAARQKEKELKQQQLAESKEAALKAKEQRTKEAKEQKIKEAALKAKSPRASSVEPKEKAKPLNTKKQKQCMMSFLAKATSTSDEPRASPHSQIPIAVPMVQASPAPLVFSVDAFRSALTNGSGTEIVRWTPLVRRRTPRVSVPVFVTMYPEGYQADNPFAAQPYAEQVPVRVRNKYKFLSFYEDVRPPYYGTWSKKSRCISGRTPFRTDMEQLEYDVDSEGEWEEGDDEVGEELGDEEEKELEDDDDEDDEEDGWLAADDEVDDDDDDDDEDDEVDPGIKKLPTKKVGMPSKRETLSVCIIAPQHGQPLSRMALESGISNCRMEGWNPNEALGYLDRFTTVCLDQAPISLQAFPPALVDEVDPLCEPPVEKLLVMSDDNKKVFASFVHRCTLSSKEKLIDEFLEAHSHVCSTRALALRTLDSMAEKRKHPCNGTFFWEVKKSVLESLGLTELAESTAMEVEDVKQEAMKTIVRFIHNNRTASKEKIVDDLRTCHESVTSSRAEAMRILQSIAVKEKHPQGGFSWIVKEEVRNELGLCLESPINESVPETTTACLNVVDISRKRKDHGSADGVAVPLPLKQAKLV